MVTSIRTHGQKENSDESRITKLEANSENLKNKLLLERMKSNDLQTQIIENKIKIENYLPKRNTTKFIQKSKTNQKQKVMNRHNVRRQLLQQQKTRWTTNEKNKNKKEKKKKTKLDKK